MEDKNYPVHLVADKLQLENVSKYKTEKEQFEQLAIHLDELVSTNFNKLTVSSIESMSPKKKREGHWQKKPALDPPDILLPDY